MNHSKYLFSTLLLAIGVFVGCQENKLRLVNEYKYFEATVNDIPPVHKIEAIAIMDYYHPEVGQIRLLVGNQKNVEKIIGHEINPKKVVDDREWIEKLTVDLKNAKQYPLFYKNAKDYSRGDIENAHMVFITKKRAYMIPIRDISDESVSGPDYQSKELKKDFDELGLN